MNILHVMKATDGNEIQLLLVVSVSTQPFNLPSSYCAFCFILHKNRNWTDLMKLMW